MESVKKTKDKVWPKRKKKRNKMKIYSMIAF